MPNILYCGPALVGSTTSLDLIGKRATPPVSRRDVENNAQRFVWGTESGARNVVLMYEYYANLYVPRLRDALVEKEPQRSSWSERNPMPHGSLLVAGWRSVAEFLRVVEGIVFVVDSQRERLEANLERIEFLEQNLRDAGRDPKTIPLVFQLNKRDLPNAAPLQTLQAALRWPARSVHVESVATKGIGVVEAFEAVLELTASTP